VNDFVEQYLVLSRAADNSILMTSLGFEEYDSEIFRCLVGGQHLDKARNLLFASESALRKCQSCLDLTRSGHFVWLFCGRESCAKFTELFDGVWERESQPLFVISRTRCRDYHQGRCHMRTVIQSREKWFHLGRILR